MLLLGMMLGVGQVDGATLENPIESAYQEDLEMSLWADGAPGALGTEAKDVPKITVRKVPSEKPTGALIICPGGGYGGLAMDHEGKQMVQWANSIGLTAVLCDYRHRGKGYGHPAPLQDAQRAVRTVRAKAAEWNIDPNKIGIIGFSAGGQRSSPSSTPETKTLRIRSPSNPHDPILPSSAIPLFRWAAALPIVAAR